jgi:hypothetical protein
MVQKDGRPGMADGSTPRAVSGEIMTNPPEGVRGRVPEVDVPGDVIDAEYISLPFELPRGESKSSGTSKSPEPVLPTPVLSIGSAAAPSSGMDMLRRTDTPAAPCKPARGGPLFWAAGIGLAFAAFWVSGGHALMRGVPFVGAEPPPSALRISGVTSRVDVAGTNAILLVDGEAANDGAAVEHLPPIAIAVTGNDGRIVSYRLGTSGRPLASGETFAFSSRLDVPKNGVKTASVAFVQ